MIAGRQPLLGEDRERCLAAGMGEYLTSGWIERAADRLAKVGGQNAAREELCGRVLTRQMGALRLGL